MQDCSSPFRHAIPRLPNILQRVRTQIVVQNLLGRPLADPVGTEDVLGRIPQVGRPCLLKVVMSV